MLTLWASQVALVVKNLPINAGDPGDVGSIPWLGRSPEGGHSSPRWHSCLENPTDKRILAGYGPWGRTGSDTLKSLSRHAYMLSVCRPH